MTGIRVPNPGVTMQDREVCGTNKLGEHIELPIYTVIRVALYPKLVPLIINRWPFVSRELSDVILGAK